VKQLKTLRMFLTPVERHGTRKRICAGLVEVEGVRLDFDVLQRGGLAAVRLVGRELHLGGGSGYAWDRLLAASGGLLSQPTCEGGVEDS